MMKLPLAYLVASAGLTLAVGDHLLPTETFKGNGDKLLTFNDTVPSAKFSPRLTSVDWVSTKQDGQHISRNGDGALVLENVATQQIETFVDAANVPQGFREYWIKPDLTKILWAVNATKQYRHSYFADYMILDRESGNLEPLVADQAGDIQYAAWSPVDDTIAFVRGNNIYIWKGGEVTQITSDGGENTFNGVPDWVYEEEMFGSRYTLWFSPDGRSIAFLRFDETGVPTYTVQYYKSPLPEAPSYPTDLDIRYPKVGETNPTVTVHLIDVESLSESTIPIDAFPPDDLVIGEVAWVTDTNEHVLVRAFNRVQDQDKHVLINVEAGSVSIVRERDGTDGWLDNTLAVTYIGSLESNGTSASRMNATSGTLQSNSRMVNNTNNTMDTGDKFYLDLSDETGYTHIYMFPVEGGEPIALTEGEWEVREILKVDQERKLVYYTSTEGHSTESHLYSVSYITQEKEPLVDDSKPAMWSSSFSSEGGYYILSYLGPGIPFQELYSVNSTEPIRLLTDNRDLRNQLNEYNLPRLTYKELKHPEGFTLNVMERLPVNFDPSKQYPAIFNPYGGPGSQMVTKAWQRLSWPAYISSDPELEYIVYTVDNRGTGYKGRAFRSAVTSQLGKLEAEDQIWAAEQLSQESFVDNDRITMWGWSFGGYLTAKVVEKDSGVFSLGMITAPVSDWRFYDTLYTERYMKTPALNPGGYNESAVHDATGFKNIANGVLIQHGTGDDNVHFQNAAVMLDLLMGAGVSPEKLRAQWFTDSDHSIRYNGATTFLYKQLTDAIFEEKEREIGGDAGNGAKKHQWSRRDLETRGTLGRGVSRRRLVGRRAESCA